jgi:hypothetical protein
MSQEFQDELYNMAYIIVLNDDNWNSNFYYQENNVVIGDTLEKDILVIAIWTMTLI